MKKLPICDSRRHGRLRRAIHVALGATPLLMSPGAQSCENWSDFSLGAEPSPRVGHAMAFHEGSGAVVLFSGASTGVLQNATWELIGSTWVVRSTGGPSPRVGHTMAYDHLRGRVMMFSGLSATQYENATWEWSGTAWTVRANTGPTPRAGHAMASLSHGGQVLLFGGANASQRFGDTWSWDGASAAWTDITPPDGPGPSARSGHAMAYDSARRVVVLFGGLSTKGLEGDTWEWSVDAMTWSQAADASTGPEPRSTISMAYDEANARTILIADASTPTQFDSETWEWNGVAWTLLAGVSDGRSPGAMIYDSHREHMTLFGGLAGDPSAIYFEVDATAALSRAFWSIHPGVEPGARRQHALSAHTARDEIVLFGGLRADNTLAGDTWRRAPGAGWVAAPGAGPSARRATALSEHSGTASVVLFGGEDSAGRRADTWNWDGDAWTELAPAAAPPARAMHAMAHDSARDRIVLFGGDDAGALGDTWEWDGAEWVQLFPAGAPAARWGHVMAYDPRSARVLLFGGTTDGVDDLNDLWAWDGAEWTALDQPMPLLPRRGASLARDGATGSLVLFGGDVLGDSYDDTWSWNGAGWRYIDASAPLNRAFHTMATEPTTGRVLLYGGVNTSNGNVRPDTWLTRIAAPSLLSHVSAQAPDLGGAAVFTADGAGSGPLAHQWRKDGVELVDDERISGAQTSTLVISPVDETDAGAYDVNITNSCGMVRSAAAPLTITTLPCPADLDGDGAVSASDLAQLLGAWGDAGAFGPADLDADGLVDASDLALLLGAWGPCD